MSYVVLARKWRPMTFADLVGQDHVSTTLANAIAQNRVAHAFLFTGVRGVGKTTSARILAKALNCLKSDGPTATPCLECAACEGITKGVDVDVQEIDGASYSGVNEVRRLQESLPYQPVRDRYKIVIVDEVHMLSKDAWNAFLKTVEEPPAHVKFIFATTEVHKVPVTILSRVQRFDFKMIPTRLIIERLRFVLAHENIQAEDAALSILARQAAGSMRDAMSLLDQVLAWSDAQLTGEGVARVLGAASRRMLNDVTRALRDGDAPTALKLVDAMANQGFDMVLVARDVLAMLRDVVIAAACDDPAELLDLPDEERAAVMELAKHPLDDLLRLHQGFSRGYDEVARGDQARAALEMLLVRLARRPPLLPVDDLIDRLMLLEKRLVGGGRAGPAPNRPAPNPSVGGGTPHSPARSAPPSLKNGGTVTAPAAVTPTAAPAPVAAAPVTAAATPVAAASVIAATVPVVAAPVTATARPTVSSAPASAPVTAPVVASAVGVVSTVEPSPELERWRSILDLIRQDNPQLGATLYHAHVVQLESDRIRLRFEPGSFFSSTASDANTVECIRLAAASIIGSAPAVSFEEAQPDPTRTLFALDRRTRERREQEEIAKAEQHPVVLEAIRVLGARLRSIELPKN